MATGKNSFVLYCDILPMVEKLPIEKAGELFIHILKYVNDYDPKTDDILINIAFEPIKQQLKRDLKNWEEIREKRVLSGLAGGLKSGEKRSKSNQNEANEANASKPKETKANEAVNVNVTVNEVINYLNNKIKKNFKSTSDKTKRTVEARLKEGYTLEDFKKVIDIKVSKWLTDPKMCDYLRPETLFGTKFESYLNETIVVKDAIQPGIKRTLIMYDTDGKAFTDNNGQKQYL